MRPTDKSQLTPKTTASYKKRRNPFGEALPDSALRYIIEAAIPYTRANIHLAFRPNQFFNDLERIDRTKYKRSTLRSAYYKALKEELVRVSHGKIEITEKGKLSLEPFHPQKLSNSHILVTFDIPESGRYKRNLLRTLLRELKFCQIQKSVWKTDYECREILIAEINHLDIREYVQIYEAVEI